VIYGQGVWVAVSKAVGDLPTVGVNVNVLVREGSGVAVGTRVNVGKAVNVPATAVKTAGESIDGVAALVLPQAASSMDNGRRKINRRLLISFMWTWHCLR
jgi:hypothetical protein